MFTSLWVWSWFKKRKRLRAIHNRGDRDRQQKSRGPHRDYMSAVDVSHAWHCTLRIYFGLIPVPRSMGRCRVFTLRRGNCLLGQPVLRIVLALSDLRGDPPPLSGGRPKYFRGLTSTTPLLAHYVIICLSFSFCFVVLLLYPFAATFGRSPCPCRKSQCERQGHSERISRREQVGGHRSWRLLVWCSLFCVLFFDLSLLRIVTSTEGVLSFCPTCRPYDDGCDPEVEMLHCPSATFPAWINGGSD